MRRLLLAAALAAGVAPASAGPRIDPAAALEQSEAAIGGRVGPHVLTDAAGAPLPLRGLRGKPLVVSLVYTSCASVCPVTTQHLLRRVAEAREALGADAFAVLTLGFDARRDTPGRMAAFAREQGIDAADWRVASADPATLNALLRELGFSYRAAAGGFEHVTQTTILDAEGRVYRQVYGDAFPAPVFIEPLKELVFGLRPSTATLGDLIDRIRFLCTVYDPGTGAYHFDYAIGFGIVIGGFSLLVSGLIIFRLWRGNRRLLAARRAKAAR